MSVLNMTLNHMMVRLQPWRFGECWISLHYYYSQVHFARLEDQTYFLDYPTFTEEVGSCFCQNHDIKAAYKALWNITISWQRWRNDYRMKWRTRHVVTQIFHFIADVLTPPLVQRISPGKLGTRVQILYKSMCI